MVGAGYLFFTPIVILERGVFTFWKKPDRSPFGVAVRLVVILVVDELISHTIPELLYGTRDLDVWPDFWLKRVLGGVMLATVSEGPFGL